MTLDSHLTAFEPVLETMAHQMVRMRVHLREHADLPVLPVLDLHTATEHVVVGIDPVLMPDHKSLLASAFAHYHPKWAVFGADGYVAVDDAPRRDSLLVMAFLPGGVMLIAFHRYTRDAAGVITFDADVQMHSNLDPESADVMAAFVAQYPMLPPAGATMVPGSTRVH